MLGHSYSEFRSFIHSTITATLAGTPLEEFLPDRMHYTPQEVVLTLVASTVSGLFTIDALLVEFSNPDAKQDVQHWGAGSSPIAGSVVLVRNLVPPSGKAPAWNGVSQKIRPFNLIPNCQPEESCRLFEAGSGIPLSGAGLHRFLVAYQVTSSGRRVAPTF